MHDRIISLREQICTHKTSSSSPRFIAVSVPSRCSEWSCIYARDINLASFYGCNIDFGIVPTVWYFLPYLFLQAF